MEESIRWTNKYLPTFGAQPNRDTCRRPYRRACAESARQCAHQHLQRDMDQRFTAARLEAPIRAETADLRTRIERLENERPVIR